MTPDATKLPRNNPKARIRAALAFTSKRTLERFACYLGVIGPTEAPSPAEIIRRIEAAL